MLPNLPSNIIFQQYREPWQYSLEARRLPNEKLLDSWIGCEGPISWPPCSPDLSCLVFYGDLCRIKCIWPVVTIWSSWRDELPLQSNMLILICCRLCRRAAKLGYTVSLEKNSGRFGDLWYAVNPLKNRQHHGYAHRWIELLSFLILIFKLIDLFWTTSTAIHSWLTQTRLHSL